MESLGYLLTGFETAVTWQNLLYCLVGVTFGMLIGVLPGLGPTAGTALLLPMTFGMEPVSAVIMLAGIYYGSMYGGTITSVLINAPGEAASLITCLDGYPLAKQGRAGVALGISAIGSFIGGTVAIIGLVIVGPLVAQQALKFGPPEFFALVVVGLSLLVGLMGKSLVRGLMAAFFGLMLAFVGMDTMGTFRFTFGEAHLEDGFDFISIAMGLFGLSELLINAEENLKAQAQKPPKIQGLMPKRDEWAPTLKAVSRGSGLGFLIGLVPGTNSVIPTILSYSMERKISKDPSRFGKGALEGVAGPETANNAYSGAALIPLFTLGIPSSPAIAVLLGAFIMHGLTPGPTLFQNNPEFAWGVIASMFVGNLILLIMNLPLANVWARITMVPFKLLFPIILIITILGTYSISNSLFDVGAMLVFGVIGYFMKKAEFPLAPVILTFVLGKILESSLLKSLTIFNGDFSQFFTRPISGTLLVIAVIMMALSIYFGFTNKKIADDVEM
ncbi:tripartite tricarboxylate transporter permease [Domibacillus sp. DTU_2020_1001157_1_SI_ALB_TIR_016]|uniref:tripartite tricarboxylate transporter permease n=1 Tax=Domibacillus sp. DTU_2020_1001157_1_SI_ALB_TIR_016 TaxID=3077789 RepID=UPI0028EFF8C9|nr:tripartite tricarboxylate transporter permease [Domibacillus sp. DTU_2020_1001157_1_SI_ALB_TIR_016]WNS78627.1 tripartite tricarboxylate transporter permease [Domibacillus sp. DTU_2020_1001157_1_SI_ALB_TIR_016]